MLQLFNAGHGGEYCNRFPACMICANQHHTNDCPLRNHLHLLVSIAKNMVKNALITLQTREPQQQGILKPVSITTKNNI